jgi:hypothetical protein
MPRLAERCFAVGLPTVVETYKSSDTKHYFKSNSLSGCLRVTQRGLSADGKAPLRPAVPGIIDNAESSSSDGEGDEPGLDVEVQGGQFDALPAPEPLVRSGRRVNLLPSGLTPPTDRIVAKHYRKHRKNLLGGVTVSEVRAAEERLVEMGGVDASSLSLISTHETLVEEEPWMQFWPSEYKLTFENGLLVSSTPLSSEDVRRIMTSSKQPAASATQPPRARVPGSSSSGAAVAAPPVAPPPSTIPKALFGGPAFPVPRPPSPTTAPSVAPSVAPSAPEPHPPPSETPAEPEKAKVDEELQKLEAEFRKEQLAVRHLRARISENRNPIQTKRMQQELEMHERQARKLQAEIKARTNKQ